jgi:hypothetical protein
MEMWVCSRSGQMNWTKKPKDSSSNSSTPSIHQTTRSNCRKTILHRSRLNSNCSTTSSDLKNQISSRLIIQNDFNEYFSTLILSLTTNSETILSISSQNDSKLISNLSQNQRQHDITRRTRQSNWKPAKIVREVHVSHRFSDSLVVVVMAQ